MGCNVRGLHQKSPREARARARSGRRAAGVKVHADLSTSRASATWRLPKYGLWAKRLFISDALSFHLPLEMIVELRVYAFRMVIVYAEV